jgi:ATP-dependent Clp protease ATP-binding subunit ClpA
MMTDHVRMNAEAVAVAIDAYDHALRLGHGYLGSEHFLLALTEADQPAGAVLREHGVTPERVEAEIARRAGAALFGDLDRDALAAIGIDVNAVRTRVEASFEPAALTSASHALHPEPRRRRPDPRRVSGASRDGVFLRHSPSAEQALHNTRVAGQERNDTELGVEHLALGLLAVSEGPVPSILSALAVSAAQLRVAILDRYRRARSSGELVTSAGSGRPVRRRGTRRSRCRRRRPGCRRPAP